MIVCAADYVGFHIVKHLISFNEQISFLILDTSDPGGFNKQLEQAFRTAYPNGCIGNQNDLKQDWFLNEIEKAKPKVGISVWWPHILKGKIISIPAFGWVNAHPSYLPFNRGKRAFFWSLVEETPYGVSLQCIDEGIDTGDIIARKKIDIGWEDTGLSLYEKSREELIQLFKDQFINITTNSFIRIKQDPNEGSFHKAKDYDKMSIINLDQTYKARTLFNIIRGGMFPPRTTTFFYDNNKKYSVEIKIKEVRDDTV